MPEEIYVLDKAVRLLQPEGGFRTSLDSVILAASCPAKPGDRVLDLGCGVGGASFCLRHRIPGVLVQGIDKEGEYIDLARQNIALNPDTGRCEFTVGDIRAFRFSAPDQRVEHVLCNPPFLSTGTYTQSPDELRAAALGHRDDEIDLKDWIDCAFHNLQPGGSLSVVHRADTVDKIIQEMGRRYGQIEIFPLWPRQGEAAKRVVVRARKDRRSPAAIHAGLVLHNRDGSYTEGAELVLRAGRALF